MEIRLLGPIEASVNGRPVALGPPQQRAVLAMLAVHVNRTVSTDRPIEGLWGEHSPPSAHKLVQLYVSHLRKLLDGCEAEIVTRGRGYELQLGADQVDAARFKRLVMAAMHAARSAARRVMRSRYGAAHRWPTSPMSRSQAPRSAGWRSCACAQWSWRSTPTSRRAVTAR